MDKSSIKLVFFVALLLVSAGWQYGVEARDITTPCTTVADCSPPGRCECKLNLCICHAAAAKALEEALVGHPLNEKLPTN